MIAVCAYKTCSCANDYECEKYEHDIEEPHEHFTPFIFDKTLPSIVTLCGGAGNVVEGVDVAVRKSRLASKVVGVQANVG